MEQISSVVSAPPAAALERRHSGRYSIEQELRFRSIQRRGVMSLTGHGQTVNISSTGVLFAAKCDLAIGTHLELIINWPAKLNDKCSLSLVARGKVVRRQQGQMALEFQQHEFRTRSAQERH